MMQQTVVRVATSAEIWAPVVTQAILAAGTITASIIGYQALKVGRATHTLVNSDRGRMLNVVAVALRSVASHTGEPLDIQAAEEAERAKREHDFQQKIVDSGNAK